EAASALVAAAQSARGAAVRISTTSPGLAFALIEGAGIPVGLELAPQRLSAEWLDLAKELGCSFVLVSAERADAALVQRARNRGLEIVLDGPSIDLERLTGALPDAVSTSLLDS
ncbi:MAG: hypothetical protein H5U40_07550, partial [Polyangiaceae bacterium]|nr:hypothetical protein [Polyangiaceae bacterium]